MTAGTAGRLSLACYQRRAVEAIRDTVSYVSERHRRSPAERRQIARELGVLLLQAPTGSGKTLILGRSLEEVRGRLDERTVWFWFAPYSGLVTQTREALAAQCASLRLRDLYTDRDPTGARDGDVFVQTWASVAATNKDTRKVRRDKEDAFSLDTMLEALRDLGFRIGVVIDEAHLNFGVGAAATRAFYLEVLSPDFTILATATPNDAKLEKFEKDAGLRVESRIVIGREEVVRAGLNKVGLMLGVLSFRDEDRNLIDDEAATLTAGWSQHTFIKNRLHEKEIAVTPLMLVQVEDQAQGQEDPVARVRQKLLEIGVPESAVAVHTSGEPDPDFHTLAYDPEIEVLIFKVAVATGFDAPRAWTLVSVRPSRGRDFGLQIVGRIMRVHPEVRPFHQSDPLLDRGYVFLSDPASQIGLDAAADDLKAVREGIEVLTDRLDVNVLGSAARVAGMGEAASLMPAVRISDGAEARASRVDQQLGLGMLGTGFGAALQDQQDRVLTALERLSGTAAPPLFPNLPRSTTARPDARPEQRIEHPVRYPLRAGLGIPPALGHKLIKL